jgi:hypothetical protein
MARISKWAALKIVTKWKERYSNRKSCVKYSQRTDLSLSSELSAYQGSEAFQVWLQQHVHRSGWLPLSSCDWCVVVSVCCFPWIQWCGCCSAVTGSCERQASFGVCYGHSIPDEGSLLAFGFFSRACFCPAWCCGISARGLSQRLRSQTVPPRIVAGSRLELRIPSWCSLCSVICVHSFLLMLMLLLTFLCQSLRIIILRVQVIEENNNESSSICFLVLTLLPYFFRQT